MGGGRELIVTLTTAWKGEGEELGEQGSVEKGRSGSSMQASKGEGVILTRGRRRVRRQWRGSKGTKLRDRAEV